MVHTLGLKVIELCSQHLLAILDSVVSIIWEGGVHLKICIAPTSLPSRKFITIIEEIKYFHRLLLNSYTYHIHHTKMFPLSKSKLRIIDNIQN